MPERNNEYVYQPPAKFTEELRQRINNAGFSDEFKQQIKSVQKEEGRKMFERLTNRTEGGIAYTKIPANPSNMVDVGECYTGRIIDRLAAYEDSGLSPEEVHEFAKDKADGRLVELPCKAGKSVYAIVNCADIIKSCDDDYFTGTGAISCSFEKDCPFEECDDGNRGVFETACKGFWVDDEGRLNVFLDYINANIGPLDFGKTVFLTREEAEKAIGGKEDA